MSGIDLFISLMDEVDKLTTKVLILEPFDREDEFLDFVDAKRDEINECQSYHPKIDLIIELRNAFDRYIKQKLRN